MDEYGDSCAPQVVTRFSVTDCSQQDSATSDADNSDELSSWTILQRDAIFGAGWPSVLYTRLVADEEPLFLISPPPISARMHVIMEGIFASVIVPEYAQLMGVNHKASAANTVAGSGSDKSGRIDNYKYIPVGPGYQVDVKSSFATPAVTSMNCPKPSTCIHPGISSASSPEICESTALSGVRRAVATLVTSDSYLQGALVLLYARPSSALFHILFHTPRYIRLKTLTLLLLSAATVFY
jgi:hypothetical protein